MKQTAIEWLEKQLRDLSFNKNTHLGLGDIRVTQGFIDEIVEKAKEMHKQEIINTYEQAMETDVYNTPLKTGKQYYNETFNK
jgi:hypothetical protein